MAVRTVSTPHFDQEGGPDNGVAERSARSRPMYEESRILPGANWRSPGWLSLLGLLAFVASWVGTWCWRRFSARKAPALPEAPVLSTARPALLLLPAFGQAVARALAPENAWNFVVYRCRPGDDCHGLGDPIAGLFGAAFAAMSMGRALKVDWPGLAKVLEPRAVDWAYRPEELRVRAADQLLLDSVPVDATLGPAFPDPAFRNLSLDAAVLSAGAVDHGFGRYWQGAGAEVLDQASPRRLLFFSGNQGGTSKWFGELSDSLHWPTPARGWLDVYPAIFQALFVPSKALLADEAPVLQLAGGAATSSTALARPSLKKLVAILRDSRTFSIGLHVPSGDSALGQLVDAPSGGCLQAQLPEPFERSLNCVERLVSELAQGASRRILVITSESTCFRDLASRHFRNLANYTDVWIQELSPGELNSDYSPNAEGAWRRSVWTWFLMQQVSMFAVSGTAIDPFLASAILSVASDKAAYSLSSCTILAKDALCSSGRYC